MKTDKVKTPKPAPPGPQPDGTPYCVHCKAHHGKPASKAEWAAAGLKCPNPYPKSAADRAAEKREKYPRTPGDHDRAMAKKGRLPENSRIFALWDGTTWRVELAIAGEDATHAATGSGLFKTIVAADDGYRKATAGR